MSQHASPHAEALKNAPPAQLASKNLVRKSAAYWDEYGTDIIRQVFDGGTIAGAAAEIDKFLPPGRFLHLADACNSWLRDPANAKYRTGNDTAYCACLGEKEESVMTAEEVYYYANDFGARVWRGVAQPQQYCTDPAWLRLHPPTEDCRQ